MLPCWTGSPWRSNSPFRTPWSGRSPPTGSVKWSWSGSSPSIPNMIFFGPSGTGKTTVARIIAERTNKSLHKLNGTSATTDDIRNIIAEINTFSGCDGILLYLDEIQYLNKKQQQSLLEYIENGSITLIASTTENPYFAVFNALISRSTLFEFKPVTSDDVAVAVERAYKKIEEEKGFKITVEDGVIV